MLCCIVVNKPLNLFYNNLFIRHADSFGLDLTLCEVKIKMLSHAKQKPY